MSNTIDIIPLKALTSLLFITFTPTMTTDWTEKYRPKKLVDVVGNPKALKTLKEWALSWDKSKPKKKAVVLIGDAGVGKTSSALALANEMGWGVVELNASDQRNSEAIRRVATSGALNETFTDSGEYLSVREGGRKLIILDEADNIFGKEDYGGVQAIVSTIRETKQPIVLVVNDYYALTRRSQAIRGLCLEIKFSKIQKASIIKVLKAICQNEGIKISSRALSSLAEHSGGDLRSAVNDLESLCLGRTEVLEEDVAILGYRDAKTPIFKALAEILKTSSLKKALETARNLDEDPEHLIMWIDENVPIEYKRPGDLNQAYYHLSRADIFLARVRRRQHYKFWGYASNMMTGGVALSKSGRYHGYTPYRFPSWLKKMSSSKEVRGRQRSLNEKLAKKTHTSRKVVQSDIYPYFSYIFNHSHDFRIHQSLKLELDAEEIAHLLKEKADSHAVKHLLDEIKESEKPRKEETIDLEETEEEGKKRGDDIKTEKQQNILDF